MGVAGWEREAVPQLSSSTNDHRSRRYNQLTWVLGMAGWKPLGGNVPWAHSQLTWVLGMAGVKTSRGLCSMPSLSVDVGIGYGRVETSGGLPYPALASALDDRSRMQRT